MQVRRSRRMAVEEEEPEVDEEQERKDLIENQIRTHKALQHMEMLQLPSATVMPVLLQLVKAYDGNWDFIEADNYHVLLDTFFSMQESEGPGSSGHAGGSRKKQKKAANTGRVKRRLSKQAESEDSDENDGSHELVHRNRARAPIVARRPEAKKKAVMDEEEDEEFYPTWQPQPLLTLPPPQQGYGLERTSKETQTESDMVSTPSNALVCYQEDKMETLPMVEEEKKPLPVVKEEKESSSKLEVPYLSDFEARREIFNPREICKTCDKPRQTVTFDPSIVKVEPPSREAMACLNLEPLLAIEAPVQAPEPLIEPLLAIEAPVEVPEVSIEPTLAIEAPVEVPEVSIEPTLAIEAPVEVPEVSIEPTLAIEAPVEVPEVSIEPTLAIEAPAEVPLLIDIEPLLLTYRNTNSASSMAEPDPCPLQEPAVEGLGMVEPAVEEPGIAEPAVEEPGMVEPAVEEPGMVEPAVEEAGNSNSNVDGALAALASYSSGSDQAKEAEVVVQEVLAGVAIPTAQMDAGRGSNSSGVDKGKQTSTWRTISSTSSKRRRRSLGEVQDEEQQSVPTIRSRHDAQDISRGKEKVPITLVRDKAGAKDLPAEFFYITSSVVYQSAHVGISVARISEEDRCSGCIGNCLDNRVPCECARLTDGEYAYTVEGCLYPHYLKQEIARKSDTALLSYCQPGACPVERSTEENCKGHIQRRFIKECWEKCGCTLSCGNRVVQRGISHRLQVFWAGSSKGWGLRTLEPLRAGTFVCEYIGEILSNTEMWHRNNDEHNKETHFFSLQLDADWCSERFLRDEEALCLDGTKLGNVARFINHRCSDPNLIDIPVEIESPDHHYYHLAFFTSKDVKVNEELTWDYGLDFNDKDHQVGAFECTCGSSFCRGKSEGAPWV